MLHRFSTFIAGCTVLLILAGSLVTSHDAGLSVPDWPTSYGWNMFTFPPSMWVANILYEHGHRLIASSVGFLTIVLATWLWTTEPRAWLRWLGVAALGAVIAQGVLGGLTVLFFLPPAVSTAHAGLAEIFFCLTVAIALFTSPGWIQEDNTDPDRHAADDTLRRLATATTVLVYGQILIGAAMRHTGAGLAIPDFPLMFGGIVPDHWTPGIAVHFAHRLGAFIVSAFVVTTVSLVWARRSRRRDLTRPALILVTLVAIQVTLGALTVVSRRNPWINSFHVVCGALVLATSLVITLRTWRVEFAAASVRLKPDTTEDDVGGVPIGSNQSVGSVRLPAFAWLRRGSPKREARRRQPDQIAGGVQLPAFASLRRGAPERDARRRQPDHRGQA
jgi:heme a synthase